MGFYLGIDGGGTSTRCVIGDEYRVLGKAAGGSSKMARVGPGPAREALQSVIRQACAAAGVDARSICQTCIGIAGASRSEVVQAVRNWASELVAGKIEVVGDMVVAHEAAFGGGAGVLVIAGTGSIGYGRNEEGKTARAGGGGPVVSDEGSGDWIGRLAVREVIRLGASGNSSVLASAVMKALEAHSPTDLNSRLSSNPPPDFATLFPIVQSAAASGDAAACAILGRAGEELAKLANTLIHELWPQAGRVRVGIHGGVLENSPLVRRTFVTRLRSNLQPARHEIAISFGLAEPVVGALSLARKMARISATGSRN